jgi:methyl-accepting chemotaxis protein
MRLRGWADEDPGEEQKLKDLETMRRSFRRRWGLVGGVVLVLAVGRVLGIAAVSWTAVGGVAAAGLALNWYFSTQTARGRYNWWYVYVLALLDALLVSVLIVIYGPGGLAVALYLAILPYAYDQGRGVGEALVVGAGGVYIAAAHLHGRLLGPEAAAHGARTYIEAAALVAVGIALVVMHSSLNRRLRRTRRAIAEAERGNLGARVPADTADELGFLEQSLNRTMDEIAATISVVQREADEVATFAEMLAVSAGEMLASARDVGSSATQLAEAMDEQRTLADDGRSDGGAAAEEADVLLSRSQRMELEAGHLLQAAERGRERVGRASQTLVSIGEEVHTSAATVHELRELSNGIGSFAQTIAHIARRTRVLALNAAIEAAHAGEHSEGFAAVADQVRVLAGEAAESAREAGDVITEIRAGIEVVATAMSSGEERVRGVGEIASEAQGALDEIHEGAASAAEMVESARDSAQKQSERLAGLAQRLARVAEISTRSASSAANASRQVTAQVGATETVTRTSQQLAELAERLQESIARFRVMAEEQTTREHKVPDRS